MKVTATNGQVQEINVKAILATAGFAASKKTLADVKKAQDFLGAEIEKLEVLLGDCRLIPASIFSRQADMDLKEVELLEAAGIVKGSVEFNIAYYGTEEAPVFLGEDQDEEEKEEKPADAVVVEKVKKVVTASGGMDAAEAKGYLASMLAKGVKFKLTKTGEEVVEIEQYVSSNGRDSFKAITAAGKKTCFYVDSVKKVLEISL